MSYSLFLDDERYPPADFSYDPIVIVRSSEAAIEHIDEFGMPTFISFDHDLGGDDTAMVFINEMIERILDGDWILPEEFGYDIHSQNPIGAQNIRTKMYNFMRSRERT